MKSSELEPLFRYAQQFLDTARGSITIDEFRVYMRNLDEDASTLSDSTVAGRIKAAIHSAKSCDYILRTNPQMKERVILPAIEKLVGVIANELQGSN
jgi:hypothetical protein